MAKSAPMRVDVLPFKYTIIAFSIALGVVVISFIVGLCGPSAETSTSSFAYKCPNNSHTWSSECKGVQPGVCEHAHSTHSTQGSKQKNGCCGAAWGKGQRFHAVPDDSEPFLGTEHPAIQQEPEDARGAQLAQLDGA